MLEGGLFPLTGLTIYICYLHYKINMLIVCTVAHQVEVASYRLPFSASKIHSFNSVYFGKNTWSICHYYFIYLLYSYQTQTEIEILN